MKYHRVALDGESLVVAFDICSSSIIMEQLLLAGDMSCLTEFLTQLKRYLASEQESVLFDPYKFTGDGWVLLFPRATEGKALTAFLKRLCRYYRDEFKRRIKPNLLNPPQLVGLTFGVDCGWLQHLTMYGQPEYIGRPLTIACRLQGAVRDRGGSSAYKALVTCAAYRKYFAHLPLSNVFRARRTLRNINGEAPFGCRKIAFLGAHAP